MVRMLIAAPAGVVAMRQLPERQREALALMQTRAVLCRYLGYRAYEQRLDRLFCAGREQQER